MAILLAFVLLIFIAIVMSILMAYPFMWIWNYAIVDTITICNPIDNFWVAFWLMMFISLFIKSTTSSKSKE